jgi:hypothetical protein
MTGLHPISHADLRPGAAILALYDDSWWPARVTRVRGGVVEADINIMGSVVPRKLPERDVAVRHDPANHAPPAVGARVVAAEQYALFDQPDVDPETVTAMLGWRRGRVTAVRDGKLTVAFDRADGDPADDEPEWLPLQAIACLVDTVVADADALVRVRGVVRRIDGAGPVLVAATIRQGDQTVAPRRTHAAPFELERDDGTHIPVAVAVDEWPRLSPTRSERGTWDELQAHPLAAPFTDFAPGPHETFELTGELLTDGDEVEIVGTRTPGDALTIHPKVIAAGRKAAAEAAAFLGQHAPEAPAEPGPRDTARGTWRTTRGHYIAVGITAIGVALILQGGTLFGALVVSLALPLAVYHHRSTHALTRFRRLPPSDSATVPIPGSPDRGTNAELVALYIAMLVVVLPILLGVASSGHAWWSFGLVALWSCILVALLAWRELPQARVLWILQRAAAHREPGAWGVTTGTFAAGQPFTRRIEGHHWTTSRTVSDHVSTPEGGTKMVTRKETNHHFAGGRVEDLPAEISLTTRDGPLAVRGCTQALWGTASPQLHDLFHLPGTIQTAIEERIAPGDSVLVFGRLKHADGERSLEHTGAGSLIVFAAPPKSDPRAAARARLLALALGVALILAGTLPALLVALAGP